MPVARDEVGELEIEQPFAARTSGTAETPVDRGRGELDERTRLDEGREAFRRGLEVGVPFRMGEHRLKPSCPKTQDEIL